MLAEPLPKSTDMRISKKMECGYIIRRWIIDKWSHLKNQDIVCLVSQVGLLLIMRGLGCSGDASSGVCKWLRMKCAAGQGLRMPADELNLFGRVDCGSVTSLRNRRSCGNVVRLIMGSEAMVTSEEMRSSEAMRILRRMDSFRNDEYPRRRTILKQGCHTQGQTFRCRNEIQSMTSEVGMVSTYYRNHHLQVETKPACLLRIRT